MHKVHMHAGAIRQLLYDCAFVPEDNPLAKARGLSSRTYAHAKARGLSSRTYKQTKLVDYPPVHTHNPYNNLHLFMICFSSLKRNQLNDCRFLVNLVVNLSRQRSLPGNFAFIFQNNLFPKYSFRNTIRVSNSLDQDCSVGLDLGPNRSRRLSADDTSRQRVIYFSISPLTYLINV